MLELEDPGELSQELPEEEAVRLWARLGLLRPVVHPWPPAAAEQAVGPSEAPAGAGQDKGPETAPSMAAPEPAAEPAAHPDPEPAAARQQQWQ